jgi:CRISPR type IV-associated protein Csf3
MLARTGMMQPLQITAHLAGSISLARPEDLALDGILAYQVLRRHFGPAFYSLPDPKECLYFASLPLAMRGSPSECLRSLSTGSIWSRPSESVLDESLWYWACSSAQIEVKGRDTQHWNKRFDSQPALSDHIDFRGRVQKIIIEQGPYKSYHMPLPLLVADKVAWYAYGDRDMIAELLHDVAAISKKRSQGNGAVRRWHIEPVEEDCSEWKDGELMRPIPGPLFAGTPLDVQHIAYRAPQWHPLNQAMCVVKGRRVFAIS